MTTNPWSGLGHSQSPLLGRRVDASHPQEWFWCIDQAGRFGLALFSIAHRPLPDDLGRLQGLDVSVRALSDGRHSLLLLLTDRTDWELFHSLCLDLIQSTNSISLPEQAVDIAVTRLRRWQRFLSRGRRPGMTEEETRGLLAELLFLRDELIPRIGSDGAVHAWAGPSGNPQDFATGSHVFEIKSHLASARNTVEITSAEQLDCAAPNFFLVVQELAPAQRDLAGSISLQDLVADLRRQFISPDASVSERFEMLLGDVGYEDGCEFCSLAFLQGNRRFFRVGETFPRIVRGGLSQAIQRVRYSLDLASCAAFETTLPWS